MIRNLGWHLHHRARAVVVASALVGAAIAAPTVLAGYAPGPFPGPAPGGSFTAVLTSHTLCAGGGTVAVNVDGVRLIWTVPARDLAGCHQFTIYAADRARLLGELPSGQHYFFAFAVAWTPRSTAPHALTFTVFDPKLTLLSRVYKITKTGLNQVVRGRAGKYWFHVTLWGDVGLLFTTA
ncbi:MAG TPA: hypothetical protein VNN74_11585 [Candidatus Micrarchaeia archaeon]|nr:hypothetical protein [Candidatus Micrarchaeia archaeon]